MYQYMHYGNGTNLGGIMVDQICMRRPNDYLLLVVLSDCLLCVCVNPLKRQFIYVVLKIIPCFTGNRSCLRIHSSESCFWRSDGGYCIPRHVLRGRKDHWRIGTSQKGGFLNHTCVNISEHHCVTVIKTSRLLLIRTIITELYKHEAAL